jgi:hypothetical protein
MATSDEGDAAAAVPDRAGTSPQDPAAIRDAVEEAVRDLASALSWSVLALDLILCLGLAAAIVPVLRHFNAMFVEMDLKGGLPLPTEVLFAVPLAGYVAGFLLLAAALVFKELLIRHKGVTLVCNLGVFVGLFLFKAVVVWALFLPMQVMMAQLSEAA